MFNHTGVKINGHTGQQNSVVFICQYVDTLSIFYWFYFFGILSFNVGDCWKRPGWGFLEERQDDVLHS